MKHNPDSSTLDAVQEFQAARLQSSIEQIRAVLNGRSVDLLSYEDVRDKIGALETNERELKDIPVDAIVGSVGRYTDFTRGFLPRQEQDKNRWTQVWIRAESSAGLPPIEAYQLGDVYFVIDGNHRVSVARSLGASHIEGYVTQVHASVPLSLDVDADELIIAERYAQFLQSTRLDQAFPDIDLKMTAAGNYRVLEERILAHQKWMGADVSYHDAAISWHKKVYKQVERIIRQRGMLRDFPNRTETDLYVWIMQHRQELAEEMGWALDHEMAAVHLVNTLSEKPAKVFKRLFQKIYDALTIDAFESGPMTGEWRKLLMESHASDRMFKRVLVAINGREDGWDVLDHAAHIAQREKGRVFGLHVCKSDTAKESVAIKRVQSTFEERCKQMDSCAGLRIEAGNISHAICDSARWVDLVVLNLAHPPGMKPTDRLSSGFSQLLRRCPCPVLAVPQGTGKIVRVLLAYDDSPASREALFIAAYLVKNWNLALTVVTVNEKERKKDTLAAARQYLEQKDIAATYAEKQGTVAFEILQTAKTSSSNLIIMGNYGAAPFFSIALGSTVDNVLRVFGGSVLVCR